MADSTIVCLAGGPSLTQQDVDACRGRARVLAIKDSIRLAPWADYLYGCDAKWWRHHAASLVTYTGPRYTLDANASAWAQVLKNTGDHGLELDPSGVKTGRNSGYQAINLAVHLGAKKIILLGFDMKPHGDQHHWFGWHPYGRIAPPYALFLRCFETIVEPLKALGITVLNATRTTALTCFPRVSLDEALA